MSRRHDPAPPGRPEPGELPVEPDQGAAVPPGSLDEDEDVPPDTPAPRIRRG